MIQVLKFGGSSVANAENIQKVISIVNSKINTNKIIVVVSALGGVTDLLLTCCRLASEGDEAYRERITELEQRHLQAVRDLVPVTNQSSSLSFVKTITNEIEDICQGIFLLKELSLRTQDRIVSYGEILSSRIITAAFTSINQPATWVDSRLLICTNDNYSNAQVKFDITNEAIVNYFKEATENLFVLPGFIASAESGAVTTLGRGGSDYTAAIVAAALRVNDVEIWTDVSGMMTADPRVVAHAKIIDQISYQEAMELSHFGAKVIYPPTIQPLMNLGINVWIKNTFAPNDLGTVIKSSNLETSAVVTGISSVNNIALISLEGSGMVGIPGFSKRLFSVLAQHKINIVLITQSSSEHSICVAISDSDVDIAKTSIDAEFEYEINLKKIEPLLVEQSLAIVALVGDGMKSHTGISGRLFAALGKNGINVRAIAQGSSERNISTVINTADVKKACNTIHEAFFEKEIKEINLFIAGIGNVGGKLLSQIAKQRRYLEDQLNIKINVCGVARSKFFLIKEEPLKLDNIPTIFDEAKQGNIFEFVEVMIKKNYRNTVFADVTANADVASCYAGILKKSIAVVACNKIAASSDFENYKKLKQLAKEFNTQFLFETNVGASLPLISTLTDLVASGDTIHKMEAVLSGTLNYVFNNYDGTKSFASVVKQAQSGGYTEPDPRLDLSGLDVMRKIMILAREKGDVIELNEIQNNSFMPEECMKGSVDDFYVSMEKNEEHFKKIYADANKAGCVLKFVAQYSDGKAKVGLQHIHSKHDLYQLYGKDNIVLFYTERYNEQPMVIKGAGAGADVTASGVFADILRAIKN